MSLRYILPLFFSLVGFLTAAAQPKARYLTPKVELGNVMWKIPALAHFEIRNTGNQPLLVTAWDKQPIAPGATTTLTVTLDAETLGTFDKSVYVTTNAENVARRLRFSGKVMQKVINYDRDFPHKIGDIRLSADNIEFDDVKRGEKPQVSCSTYPIISRPKPNRRPFAPVVSANWWSRSKVTSCTAWDSPNLVCIFRVLPATA